MTAGKAPKRMPARMPAVLLRKPNWETPFATQALADLWFPNTPCNLAKGMNARLTHALFVRRMRNRTSRNAGWGAQRVTAEIQGAWV